MIRPSIGFVIALALVFAFTADRAVAQQQPEKMISRQEADAIFSMTRAQWEDYAKTRVHPLGWPMRLMSIETGTGFVAVDPKNETRLTFQPLYRNAADPPDMIVVGSWYPAGRLQITPDLVARVQRDAQADLGDGYTVTANAGAASGLEGVELVVRRK